MQKKISLFSLVLLIVAAIDSIRTLPTTALFGSSLVFFFLFSAGLFLIPISLVSAEFSSRYPEEGGVFYWIRGAFGEKLGVVAVWLQWINTMVWYPTMLLFIAGTGAYLVNPALAENRAFLLSLVLAVFWGLTLLNLRGIQVSARVNSFCGIIGTLLPMGVLIALGIRWVALGNPLSFSSGNWDLWENRGALVTIMASFLGMELAGVHVSDMENPQKNFPKAVGYSVFILLGTLIFGALSVAVVVPREEIHFVDGVMQTFAEFFHAFHIPQLIPVLALLIMMGSIGGSINWLLSPAKGLLQAAEHGFLPPFFAKKNRHSVSARLLIFQALLVTAFSLVLHFMPSVNAFYWFLMALSTALYMAMYILLFLAALKLGRPNEPLCYQIPRGTRTAACLIGIAGCALTIAVGFELPPDVSVEDPWQYARFITLGFIFMLAPASLLVLYQKRQKRLALSAVE